jgi:hypothetical protein
MKNLLPHLALLSTLATCVACDIGAPKRQGPTRPGVDKVPSQGPRDDDGGGRGGVNNENPTCEERGLVTGASGECESSQKSCEERGLVTGASGECESPQKSCEERGLVTGASGECVDKPLGPIGPTKDNPAGPVEDVPADDPTTASQTDGKSITLTALQSTFLISLDTAKPNCFVEQGATITVDSAAAKEFTANPAQISTKVLESSTKCPAGTWNHFKSHFK